MQDLRKLCLAMLLEMTAEREILPSLPVIFCEFLSNSKHSTELCENAVDSGAIELFCGLLLEALQKLPSMNHKVGPQIGL